jgi:preprotein translocase subunit Sec63
MNPIRIGDEISYAYDEAGYYYVSLILLDDDACDGYPSYQTFMNGGGYDMEFYTVDLS